MTVISPHAYVCNCVQISDQKCYKEDCCACTLMESNECKETKCYHRELSGLDVGVYPRTENAMLREVSITLAD